MIALFLVLFIASASMTITLMSGLYIVYDLGGTQYLPIYTVAFFGLGNAVSVPLGNYIGDLFGSRRALCTILITYACASFTISFAEGYTSFLVGRFIEGLLCGPCFILAPKLVPADKKKLYTIVATSIFTAAPVLGACYGAILAYLYAWQDIFQYMALLPLCTALFIPNYPEENKKTVLDVGTYVLYAIALISLGFVAITGQLLDWYRSFLLINLFIIGIVASVFFILWNRTSPHPIINFSLLKRSWIFVYMLVNLGVLFSIYYGSIMLLGTWLALYVHYDVAWIGLLIGAMALSGAIPLVFALVPRWQKDTRIMLAIGLLFLILSFFHSSVFNAEVDLSRIVLSRLSAGIGLAFFLPSITRILFKTFEPSLYLDAVVCFQTVRTLATGVGAALVLSLWQTREIFYHDRFSGTLNLFSLPVQLYAEHFSSNSQLPLHLEQALNRQSLVLALEDIFYFMGWIAVSLLGGVIATFFYRGPGFFPESTGSPIKKEEIESV